MKHLRRWAMGLLIATLTLVSILSCQTYSANSVADNSSAPNGLTLETAGLALEPLADGVYGLIASTDFPPANPATDAICNGGIIVGDDGVLVVDPFQNADLANLLLETVATLTDQPIRYVVNTHYHFDHTGGNPAVASRSIPLLGRGPIREYMLTRNGDMDPQITPPEIIIDGTWDIWLGDREVNIRDVDGHSGGTDLVVYVPDADVLMAGDLLFNQRIPFVADGNIRIWQEHLTELISNYPTATILPGHGPVTDVTGLEAQQAFFNDLEALALEWQETGVSEEAAISTPLPEKYADYLFHGLFESALATAYQQITLGQDDAASIQFYFQAQAPALKAL
jgi:cyclase